MLVAMLCVVMTCISFKYSFIVSMDVVPNSNFVPIQVLMHSVNKRDTIFHIGVDLQDGEDQNLEDDLHQVTMDLNI